MQEHGHQILLLQQLQRQPASPLLQELPALLTAGGTMRNVPVGAGRRKNKNSSVAQYRHLTMTGAAAIQAIHDPIHHTTTLNPNGTVLSFGSDRPLCESMSSVLSLAEKTMKNSKMEEQSTVSSSIGGGTQNCQAFPPPQVPYVNGSSPWPYPWNPPPPPGAVPFCGLNFPIPIYPATAYWGNSAWNMPWLLPLDSPPPTSASSAGSGPNSPTLGKHSRDGNVLHKSNSNQEKNLWIPKTLRIDDPEEAAKSSIWASMGFKNDDKADGASSRGGFFREFQTKAELSKNHKADASSRVLHANPAALSRSINFLESS